MKIKKAKLFVCHHPAGLLLHKNLIRIIKKYDSESKIILFKINHPYFAKLNFEPYKKYFDEIREFDFIHYKKNLLLSYWEIFNFQKKLKRTISNLLTDFEKIDLFLDFSAYLPINILLYNLSKQKNIKNINKFTSADLECSQIKTNKIRTFLCHLYSLPFKCFKVRAINTPEGKFIDFVYNSNTLGVIVKIVSPISRLESKSSSNKEKILPYPIISKHSSTLKKDMVIIFGNAIIHPTYSECLPSYRTFVEKLTAFFKAIENKYPNCKLYYKPHPVDKGKLMPGINTAKYNFFDDTINAQAIFDRYHGRIKAVYSFASTTSTTGSFLGLPSYTFYRYLCNPKKIDKADNIFNTIFNQDNIKSEFLFHIGDLNEIGKIDNLESPKIDVKELEKKYREILNV